MAVSRRSPSAGLSLNRDLSQLGSSQVRLLWIPRSGVRVRPGQGRRAIRREQRTSGYSGACGVPWDEVPSCKDYWLVEREVVQGRLVSCLLALRVSADDAATRWRETPASSASHSRV
jgi:hypothetical protein